MTLIAPFINFSNMINCCVIIGNQKVILVVKPATTSRLRRPVPAMIERQTGLLRTDKESELQADGGTENVTERQQSET